MRTCLAAISALTISACSSPATRTVDASAAKTFMVEKITSKEKDTTQLTEENNKLLEAKLQEVLEFCLPRLSGFETASASQAQKAYWLSMSGLISGSVIVPALTAANATANAAGIAGLSGWAGATNFAGQALRSSGLSGSTIAETRNTIIKNVRDSIGIASDGARTFDERRGALMKARAECIMYEIAVPSIPSAN